MIVHHDYDAIWEMIEHIRYLKKQLLNLTRECLSKGQVTFYRNQERRLKGELVGTTLFLAKHLQGAICQAYPERLIPEVMEGDVVRFMDVYKKGTPPKETAALIVKAMNLFVGDCPPVPEYLKKETP